MRPDIRKVGLCTVRDGRMLMCRKRRGHQRLILPGGKIEQGETPMECLERELREELGRVKLQKPVYLETYTDEAADKGKIVEIQLYSGDLVGEPEASSEIGELVWLGARDSRDSLSPIMVNKILPDLIVRGILPW